MKRTLQIIDIKSVPGTGKTKDTFRAWEYTARDVQTGDLFFSYDILPDVFQINSQTDIFRWNWLSHLFDARYWQPQASGNRIGA